MTAFYASRDLPGRQVGGGVCGLGGRGRGQYCMGRVGARIGEFLKCSLVMS